MWHRSNWYIVFMGYDKIHKLKHVLGKGKGTWFVRVKKDKEEINLCLRDNRVYIIANIIKSY